MNAPRSPLELTLPSPLNPLEEALGFPIDGTFSTRYRLRWTRGGENEHDQDLYQDLYLGVGDPSRNRVSGVFHGRLTEDIDGRPREGFHVYEDITDTYDHRVNGRFYLGYLDLRRLGWMDRAGLDFIRGGRQTFEESAETFIFDGGRIDTRPFRSLRDLRFTAYGGLPVHYFESSPSGDVVAGAGVEARPIPDGRVRIDSTYIEDRRDEVHARDHLLSFALWQSLGERFSLHGRYNLLDGDSRDYTVRGTYQEAPLDLLVQASFHQVVKTLRQLSTELDPYFSVVQELRPYWQASGRASKGFGKHVVVDAGMDVRELQHEEDEADFNHEFLRYYVTPATRDWPAKGMSLAVTVEMWDSSDDEIFTAGAEVSQRILQVLLASAGTYYSLYKYDLFAREERTRVRTYFGRLEYRLARDLRLHGVYEYERDDEFDYHIVELGVRYSF